MRDLLRIGCLAACLIATAHGSVMAAAPLWKVVGDESKSDFNTVRINTSTGQAWYLDSSMSWAPLPEKGTAPAGEDAGTYDCIAYYPSESTSWFCIRYNVRTGQTWNLTSNTWVDVAVKN